MDALERARPDLARHRRTDETISRQKQLQGYIDALTRPRRVVTGGCT